MWNELQAALKEAGVWMKDRNGSSSAEMGEPVSPWVGAPLPAPGAGLCPGELGSHRKGGQL